MNEHLATGPLDAETYKHQARILQAQHYARPVWFQGQQQFVQVASSRLAGGKVEMDVYFTGRPAAVDSALIALKNPNLIERTS